MSYAHAVDDRVYGGHGNSWWMEPENDAHGAIKRQVDTVRKDQSYVEEDNKDHLQLYCQRKYSGMQPEGVIEPLGADDRIRLNMIKSAIDTVAARICMNKPRPMFVTAGGRWGQRLKAQKLQKFVEGVFYECDAYHEATRAFKDAAIFGTGFIKLFVDDGRVKLERVFPDEIIVDEKTAISATPSSYFQRKYVPVEKLLSMFPDQKDFIMEASMSPHSSARGVASFTMEVLEAWHVPSEKDKSDGRHIICTKEFTLLDEGWEYDFPPWVELRWNRLPIGYYGNGAAEDLHGMQKEINYLMEKVQKAMHVCSNAWLLVHESDSVPLEHFTNEDGIIIQWSGNHEPKLVVQPAVHQQVMEQMRWLYSTGFDDIGVSQMSATSRKPPGIESGVALQTMLDVESQRFLLLAMSWEKMFVELAKRIVTVTKSITTGGQSDYKVKHDAGNFINTIKWSEVNIDEDEYILKVWPTNLLPATPAGRLDAIEKMLMSGMLDPQTGMMLLDFPDLEAYQSLRLANLKNILWVVDQVVYEGNYVEPKSFHDLDLGVKHMQAAALRAETEGAPEKVINRCMEWIVAAKNISDRIQPPPQAMPQIPGMPPMPGGPPTPAPPVPAQGPVDAMPAQLPPGVIGG